MLLVLKTVNIIICTLSCYNIIFMNKPQVYQLTQALSTVVFALPPTTAICHN